MGANPEEEVQRVREQIERKTRFIDAYARRLRRSSSPESVTSHAERIRNFAKELRLLHVRYASLKAIEKEPLHYSILEEHVRALKPEIDKAFHNPRLTPRKRLAAFMQRGLPEEDALLVWLHYSNPYTAPHTFGIPKSPRVARQTRKPLYSQVVRVLGKGGWNKLRERYIAILKAEGASRASAP